MVLRNLPDLPAELRAMAVQYITHPSDLYSLCLTSRDLCSIATPLLY